MVSLTEQSTENVDLATGVKRVRNSDRLGRMVVKRSVSSQQTDHCHPHQRGPITDKPGPLLLCQLGDVCMATTETRYGLSSSLAPFSKSLALTKHRGQNLCPFY